MDNETKTYIAGDQWKPENKTLAHTEVIDLPETIKSIELQLGDSTLLIEESADVKSAQVIMTTEFRGADELDARMKMKRSKDSMPAEVHTDDAVRIVSAFGSNTSTGTGFSARLDGDGAIAQGNGARAYGANSINIEGNVAGIVNIGNNNRFQGGLPIVQTQPVLSEISKTAIIVRIPVGTTLNYSIEAKAGDITLDHLTGSLIIDTDSAHSKLSSCNGDIQVKARQGCIELHECHGKATAESKEGSVTIDNCTGNLYGYSKNKLLTISGAQNSVVNGSSKHGEVLVTNCSGEYVLANKHGAIRLVDCQINGNSTVQNVYGLTTLSADINSDVKVVLASTKGVIQVDEDKYTIEEDDRIDGSGSVELELPGLSTKPKAFIKLISGNGGIIIM